jgi:hypothetical protein
LAQQAAGILASDFFCVETVWSKTVYVLFFIELLTPKVRLAGVSAHPDSSWVTQQARNLAIEDRLAQVQFVIHDRDAKYSGPFNEVFRTEGVRVIHTPIRSPKANAVAERFNTTLVVVRPRQSSPHSVAIAPGLCSTDNQVIVRGSTNWRSVSRSWHLKGCGPAQAEDE